MKPKCSSTNAHAHTHTLAICPSGVKSILSIGLLLPGDVILADCGFTIEQAAKVYCTKVKILHFMHADIYNNLIFNQACTLMNNLNGWVSDVAVTMNKTNGVKIYALTAVAKHFKSLLLPSLKA